MNKPIKLQTQGLTFESGAVLYASQLTSLRDKIDEVIDFLPASFAQTSPTTPGDGEEIPPVLTEEQIQRMVNDAKQELQNKINTINAWISQQPDGNTQVRTDEEMVDLFKGPFKSLLFQYGLTDADGHPYFDLFFEEIGVDKAYISGWIDKSNQSNIGIKASKIIIDGDTNLTGELTAIKAKFSEIEAIKADIQEINSNNINVADTIQGKHIKGGDINIGNGVFVVDSDGHVTANDIIMSGQGHWITMRQYESITLPEARPGSQVTLINKVPTAEYVYEGEPNYRTISTPNRQSRIIFWDVSGRKWSDEGYRLASPITNRIVFATFISDGQDWYVMHAYLNNGTAW